MSVDSQVVVAADSVTILVRVSNILHSYHRDRFAR
ncbi:hypothetical protein MGAST_26175 [Mycobacterium gastri 'Wayne']|nr:hypothetical protein MGAST_26175 [Mycobacterium gastri 'Wayne']